ncbi:unnamed protein product [Ceutorhynchus assimilis]|uniref:Uncharacterized protein n=1 Tax=Ceutorhynchus assimilis TaxID=467358 RepID=A0A9N9MGY0_9CUCU|nr:unnamed protein product [Ceutorhynchus assimilis]
MVFAIEKFSFSFAFIRKKNFVKMKTFLVLTVTAFLFYAAFARDPRTTPQDPCAKIRCPKRNEICTEGNSCLEQCGNSTDRVCPLSITTGCFCKQGYCRSSCGKCQLLKG